MTNGIIVALANLYGGIHTAGLVASLQQTVNHVQNGKVPGSEYRRGSCLLWVLSTGAPALFFLFE